MSISPSSASYRSYKNLPALAGLCSFEEATTPGLSVEDSVHRLKRFHYCLKRLHAILTAKITSEPIYELKMGFAHHAYLCAEHVDSLRKRIGEMREPPLGLEEVPHPALEVFFGELQCAPDSLHFLAGVYGMALTVLERSMHEFQKEAHPLADAPSRRVIRFALLEVSDMVAWGRHCELSLQPKEPTPEFQSWLAMLDRLLGSAGGLDGASPESGEAILRQYSETPYQYDPIPQRDERFQDLWNQGVNAEAFLYHPEMPAHAKVLMMLFKRLREIDVPEMMASILAQTTEKPWAYFKDMSRQIWDEARHAMMGEVGFVALGIDWTQAAITYNWSYRLNTECTPKERHGVLFFIEQGLMPKTGKRYEHEVATQSEIPLARTIQDFDWADEVLHSQIGRQWYVTEFASIQAALKFGDTAWSKITSNWATVKDQGLTEHANWWPNMYRQGCANLGIEPDPQVLNFADTYEGKRADIHRTAGE